MWATEVFVIHQCVGQKRFWMCRRQYGSDPIKNWRTSRHGEHLVRILAGRVSKSIVSVKALTKSVAPNVSSENLRACTHVRLRVEELLPGILAPNAPVHLRRPYCVFTRHGVRPASRLDKNERREDSDVEAKVNRATRRGRSQVPSATVGTEELPCDVFHSVVFLLLLLAGKFRPYILGRVGVGVKRLRSRARREQTKREEAHAHQ